MTCVNLISTDRRIRQRRATCIMRWATGLAAWGALVTVACIGATAISNIDSDFESTRSALVLRTTAAQSSASQSKAVIDGINKRLTVSKAVRAFPDWSVLLPVVSGELGSDIALEKISLEPVRGEQARQRATLVLTGVGTSRAAVSDFVLRLEEAGVFTRVETASAQRRPIREHEFFAFELNCRIGTGWEGTSP